MSSAAWATCFLLPHLFPALSLCHFPTWVYSRRGTRGHPSLGLSFPSCDMGPVDDQPCLATEVIPPLPPQLCAAPPTWMLQAPSPTSWGTIQRPRGGPGYTEGRSGERGSSWSSGAGPALCHHPESSAFKLQLRVRRCDSFLELFINISHGRGAVSFRRGTHGRLGLRGRADRCLCPAQNHFPNFLRAQRARHICVEEAEPALTGNERQPGGPGGCPRGQVRQEGSSWEGREVARTLLKPFLYAAARDLAGFLLCPLMAWGLWGALHPSSQCCVQKGFNNGCRMDCPGRPTPRGPTQLPLSFHRPRCVLGVSGTEFFLRSRTPRVPSWALRGLSPCSAEAWPLASSS